MGTMTGGADYSPHARRLDTSAARHLNSSLVGNSETINESRRGKLVRAEEGPGGSFAHAPYNCGAEMAAKPASLYSRG